MTTMIATIISSASRYTGCCRFLFKTAATLAISAFFLDPAPVHAQDVYLCVWRNPERTMTKIFPDAKDYKTMTVNLDDAKRDRIETLIGSPLLPGQRDQFQYFEMTAQGGETIGYIIPVTQKGEFGAVEFVFGLNTDFSVRDLYIQRARERDQSFKQRNFLDLFKSIKVAEASVVPERYTGVATPGTTAVIKGLIKALTEFDQLVLKM